MSGDSEHEASNRIRGSATVIEERGPRIVSSRHGILTERADEIVEQRRRQVELTDRVRGGPDDQIINQVVAIAVDRLRVRSFEGHMQPPLPCGETRQPLLGRRIAFVGHVVRHSSERVHRRDVRPHRRRQEARRHGKILVVRSGQGFARGVRPIDGPDSQSH